MFGNDNPEENGELHFYSLIKNYLNVIFDVGSRDDSIFLNEEKQVHYFEPNVNAFNSIKNKSCRNIKSYFNNFALGDKKEKKIYYDHVGSFIPMPQGTEYGMLDIDTGDNYIKDNEIKEIDLLKIDTEGYEFSIIKGFQENLKNIKIIQFEYGGSFLHAKVKLIDVINLLKENNFINFSYISNNGLVMIEDFSDHYVYCNIACFNKKYTN